MADNYDFAVSIKLRTMLIAGLGALVIASPKISVASTNCLQVTNVEFWDFLNIREKPSAESRIVGAIAPGHSEPLERTGACIPRNVRPTARWCPVIYYPTRRTSHKGYVKAFFTRPLPCPPSLEIYKNRKK